MATKTSDVFFKDFQAAQAAQKAASKPAKSSSGAKSSSKANSNNTAGASKKKKKNNVPTYEEYRETYRRGGEQAVAEQAQRDKAAAQQQEQQQEQQQGRNFLAEAMEAGTKAPGKTGTGQIDQYGAGNIDLYNRNTNLYDADGNLMTVRSMSFNDNGKETLIPTVVNKDGKWTQLSDEDAIDWYRKTGEYLGKFDSIEEANDYAEKLHQQQEDMYTDPFAAWEAKEAQKNQHYDNYKAATEEKNRLQRIKDANQDQYMGTLSDEQLKELDRQIAAAEKTAADELAASGGQVRFEDQTPLQRAWEVAKGIDTGAGNQFTSALSGVGAALAGRDTIVDDLLTAGRAAFNRNDGVSAGQALRSLDDIVAARIEEDFTKGLENIRDRGAGIFNKVFNTNIDTENDWASQKHQEKVNALEDEKKRFHTALGDAKNPFADFNDLRKQVAKEQAEQKAARYANAPAAGLVDKYGTMAGASLPNIAIATGMALVGHPEASVVMLQEGSTASLAYAAALNGSTGLTQLSTIMSHSLGELASNPTFWMAYGTEMGNAYNEAIDDGADQTTAALYSAIYGGISAIIELGGGADALGGFEKTAPGLMGALAAGDKMGAAKILVGNIISEIGEEEGQGAMERGLKSMYTDVPIYSDSKRTVTSGGKVVNTPEGQADPNAIINPAVMAETAKDTAITTAILGGGQTLMAKGANVLSSKQQAKLQEAKVGSESSQVIRDIKQAGTVTPEQLQQIRSSPELQEEFEKTFGFKLQDNSTDVQYQSNAAELDAKAQDTVKGILGDPKGENGELSNSQIRQIVNDPQLRKAFKDITGFEPTDKSDSQSRAEMRRAIDAYETNQEEANLEVPEEVTASQEQAPASNEPPFSETPVERTAVSTETPNFLISENPTIAEIQKRGSVSPREAARIAADPELRQNFEEEYHISLEGKGKQASVEAITRAVTERKKQETSVAAWEKDHNTIPFAMPGFAENPEEGPTEGEVNYGKAQQAKQDIAGLLLGEDTLTTKQASEIASNELLWGAFEDVTGINLENTAKTAKNVQEAFRQAKGNLDPNLAEKFNIETAADNNYNNASEVNPNGQTERSTGENQGGVPGTGRTSGSPVQVGNGHGGVSGSSGVVLLSDKAQQTIKDRGKPVVDLKPVTDLAAFSFALDAARDADPEYGWAVTPKTEADLSDPGTKVFMSPDGSTGFAIKPDGDIVAVFRNKNTGKKRSTASTIPMAIANGGTKLDCYSPGLVDVYAQFGFVPVAKVQFNGRFANPGWRRAHGEQTVYVMMHNGDSVDTVVENAGKYDIWGQDKLDALPEMEYDAAMAYRDSLLEQQQKAQQEAAQEEAPAAQPAEQAAAETPASEEPVTQEPSDAKRTIRSMMDNAAKNDEAGAVSQADAMKILDSKELFKAYQEATDQTADEARLDLYETAGVNTGMGTDQKVPPRVEKKWKKAAETDAESLIDLVESDENDADWFKKIYQDATGQELSDDPALRLIQLTDFSEAQKKAAGEKKKPGKVNTPKKKTNAAESGLNSTEKNKPANPGNITPEEPAKAKEADVVDILMGKENDNAKIPKEQGPSNKRRKKISQYFSNTLTKTGETEGVDPYYNPQTEAESLAKAVMMLGEDYQGTIDMLVGQEAWTSEMVDAANIIGRQLSKRARRADTPEARAAAERDYKNWGNIRKNHISKTGGGLQAVAKQSRPGSEAVYEASIELLDKYGDKKVAKKLGITEKQVNETRENVTKAVNELEELENRIEDYEDAKKEGKADKATEKKLKNDLVNYIMRVNAKRNTGLFIDKVLLGTNTRVNAKVNAGQAAEVRSLLGAFLKQNDLDYIQRYAALVTAGMAEDLKYKESSIQTKANKVRTLHTLGMLLSLGATKRNLWGNGTMSGIDLLSNNVVGLMTDAAVSQMTGTGERAVGFRAGILNPKVWAAAYASFRNSLLEVAGNVSIDRNAAETDAGKWGLSQMRSFDPNGNVLDRIASGAEQALSYMLSSTDAAFRGGEEQDIISALTRANKNSKASAEDIKKVAQEQASYELFQNKGFAAKSAEKARDYLNVVGVGGEGKLHKGGFGLGDLTIKFPVVPSNIGVKLLEHTPPNMVKGLLEITKVINEARATGKTDLVKQNQAVMDFARGTTGTALIGALVYLMRSDKFKGLFKAFKNWDNEEDKDLKALNKAHGKSGMQVNLSLWDRLADGDTDESWREGDDTIDISANEPADQYIRTASMIAEYIDENPEAAFEDKALAAAWAVGKASYDSILAMPLMQNFATIGDSITYSPYKAGEDATDKEKAVAALKTAGNAAAGSLGSSISGFVPAGLAHKAAVQDEWQRDTTGKNALERAKNQILYRIPGEKGRESLPIKTDPFGNPISAGSEETRRKNAYRAYKYSTVTDDENTAELEAVREATGKALFPSRNGPKSYTYGSGDDAQKVEFTTAESKEINDKKGQAYNQELTELRKTDEYKRADWDTRAAMISALKSYDNAGAKAEVAKANDIEYDDEYKDIRALNDPVETLAFKTVYDQAKKDEDWRAVDVLLDSARNKKGDWKLEQDTVDYLIGKDSKINYYTYLSDKGVPTKRAKDFEAELKTLYEGEKREKARASDIIRVAGNGNYTAKEADAIMNYEGEVSKETIEKYQTRVQYQLDQAGLGAMNNEVWKRIQMVADGEQDKDVFRRWIRNEAKDPKNRSGIPAKQGEEIIDIMTNYTSDDHVAGVYVTAFYNAARSINCSPRQALQFFEHIDTNYNGSYSKTEIDAAVAWAFGYDSKSKYKYYGKTYTKYKFSGQAKKVRDAITKATGR